MEYNQLDDEPGHEVVELLGGPSLAKDFGNYSVDCLKAHHSLGQSMQTSRVLFEMIFAIKRTK